MRKRVLVVACSPVVRLQVRFTLEKHGGCEVVEASSADEALRRLQGVVLIVSEARSSKIDGLELLAAVKASSPGLPVILLGVDGNGPLVDAARAGGALAWVVKPIDPTRLADAVTRLSPAVSG